MDKQDLILIIVILLLLVDFTDAVWGAQIYYDDGTVVSVPDEWIKIEKPQECEVEKFRLVLPQYRPPPSQEVDRSKRQREEFSNETQD